MAKLSTNDQWADTLDRFEAGLDHHEGVLERAAGSVSADLDAVNPWPPAELPRGPIPDRYVERAKALAQRCDAMQDDVVAALAEAINPPRRTSSSRPSMSPVQRSTPEHPRISIEL